MYSLVHFGFIVQHGEALGLPGVTVEDEAEISALALHVIEVYQSGVKS